MTDTTAAQGLTREGTPRQRHRFAVPSTWIAQKTGYGRTGIYRMRTEHDTRPPTMSRMQRMADTLGWSRTDQMKAVEAGRWIEEFEAVVLKLYTAESKGK